jgi:NAD(P)H-flavin reductase
MNKIFKLKFPSNIQISNYYSKKTYATIKNKLKESMLEKSKQVNGTFLSKVQVANNCYIMRFLLPDEKSSLGFKTGQHIFLEATIPELNQLIKRPYHPISLDTDKGYLDIMIKVYKQTHPHRAIFSNYLNTLEV